VLGIVVVAGGACTWRGSRYLVVTTATDGRDADVDDGVCEVTPGEHDCSLRAAIDETNHSPGTHDRIWIANGIDPILTIAGTEEDANATGDLDVLGSVTIHGRGAVVDANRLDRVLDHHTGELAIDRLAVTGGELSGEGFRDEIFGPILVPGNGGVGPGGGIRSAGALSMTNSTISDNRNLNLRLGGLSARGAGLSVTTGPVRLDRVAIEANVIDGGSGGYGAGLDAQDVGDLTITESTIRGNRLLGWDGGFIAFGGGVSAERSVVRVDRSTITSNVAIVADAAGSGAGVRVEDTDLTIVRSTLSANDAGIDLRPIDEVFAVGGVLTIISSTIVGDAEVALYATDATTATIGSSAIIGRCSGPIVSGGWNVTAPADPSLTACPLADPTDLAAPDLVLGSLADNGGPTPTHLPGPASPLVDRIPIGSSGSCDQRTIDQRGARVPAGAGCDVGAVEVRARDRTP
jgi:hypothetical protein